MLLKKSPLARLKLALGAALFMATTGASAAVSLAPVPLSDVRARLPQDEVI